MAGLPGILACVLLAGPAPAVEIRVAPGDPGGLEAARDKARAALRRGPVTVVLAAGTYALDRTLVLTASDSGTAAAPVTWKAAKSGRVRFSGGREISSWAPLSDGKLLARLPPAARGRVLVADLRAQGVADFGTFRRRGFGLSRTASGLELVCDDRMMTLARHPTTGWLRVSATLSGGAVERFAFEDESVKRWSASPDLWVHGYWTFDWADTHDPLVAFDPGRGEAAIAAPQSWYGVKTGTRFAFENALESLDAPGEWWLDRVSSRLLLWPAGDGAPHRAVVTRLEAPLLMLDGASHVRIEGLVVEDGRGDGIVIRGGADCRILGCAIRNLGGLGVAVEGGRGHLVRSCDVYGTGEGAIALAGGDRATLEPCGHAAENNDLHDYCRWSHTYRPGVLIEGVGCRVANNHIHDAPHNGILLGGNDHLIERNVIERVCLETGDSGALYMGRDPTARGTVIRHNLFRNLAPTQSRPGEFNHVMAVYLDDCACGTRVEGNLFLNTGWGVMVGGGRDNAVLGNVFMNCDPAISVDARARGWAKDYYKAGGGWEMEKKLAAAPIRSAVWRSRYPRLADYSLATCAAPAGNRITGNVCAGGRWLQLNDGLTERDAGVAENLVEGAGPSTVLRTGPELRRGAGGTGPARWPAIPIGKIGLYDDGSRRVPPKP